jgi:hypothetical protein
MNEASHDPLFIEKVGGEIFTASQGMAVAATAVMPAFWFVRGSRSASLSAWAGLGESLPAAGEVLPCRGLLSRGLLSAEDDLRYIDA